MERLEILFDLLDLSTPITILRHLSHSVDLLLQKMLLSNTPYRPFLFRHFRSLLTFCSQLSPCSQVIVLWDLNFGSKVEALNAAT